MPIGVVPGETSLEKIVIPAGPFGNPLVTIVDAAVRFAIYLTNPGGDILANAETAPGTYTVHRIRAGTDVEITSATAATEALGVISAVVDFSDGNWVQDDLGYIEFSAITVTLIDTTTELPVLRRSFRVVGETSLDVPAADATTNAQMRDVVGNKEDAATQTVGTTASLLAMIKGILNGQARQVYSMTFWSDMQALVTITAASQDLALPDVVVSGIPSGVTILRAIAILKYRLVEDSSAADNALSLAGPVTPAVQVRADTPGTYIDAINLIADQFQVAASTREAGDVLADGANLLLRDVQVGLRIEWTV